MFYCFSGALNSGLPLMFDREFGFLNRLLVAPLTSRLSIVLSSFFYITILSFVQSVVIMIVSYILGYGWPNLYGLGIVFTTLILLVLFCDINKFMFSVCFARTYWINRSYICDKLTSSFCKHCLSSNLFHAKLAWVVSFIKSINFCDWTYKDCLYTNYGLRISGFTCPIWWFNL